MSIINQLRLLYLCHFSKPAADRLVYRAIRRYRPRKIVELGIGDGRRGLRMIEVAGRDLPRTEIHYVGMDPFEGRTESSGPPIRLKTVHQRLRATEARIQLVPGDPAGSMIRLANSLRKVDLLIVPAEFDSPCFARMWYFVPRTLHARTLVFVEGPLPDGRRSLRLKPRREIDQLAASGFNRRAA